VRRFRVKWSISHLWCRLSTECSYTTQVLAFNKPWALYTQPANEVETDLNCPYVSSFIINEGTLNTHTHSTQFEIFLFSSRLVSFSHLLTEPKSPPLSSPTSIRSRILPASPGGNYSEQQETWTRAKWFCLWYLNAKTSEFWSDAQIGEHGQGNSLWGYDSIARYGKKIF
jgi:hypothetical protein